jgi:phosphoribosylformimino-5-aminoimidazole carboxamide ribotide isomerase
MARRWVDAGAKFLHLVDLDGARAGRPVNLESIAAIRAAVDIPCELGGGIRDDRAVSELLALGIDRLVIGTQALKRPQWFRELCRRHPHKLVLGIDARGGRVATEGWLETSETPATELAAQFAGEPLAALIYTDIDTDGMLAGPNLKALAEMQSAVSLPIIASGGVTTAADVRKLAAQRVEGCIIGRALYEGSLTLEEALAAAQEPATA